MDAAHTETHETLGVHHVGLAVTDIAAARRFFIEALGYRHLGDLDDYPASFVIDGHTMVTLWQVADPAASAPFDRRVNVGLHHLALRVPTERLTALYEKLRAWPDVVVEFEPCRNAGLGDASHFMVGIPGGGLRVEFVCAPAVEGH